MPHCMAWMGEVGLLNSIYIIEHAMRKEWQKLVRAGGTLPKTITWKLAMSVPLNWSWSRVLKLRFKLPFFDTTEVQFFIHCPVESTSARNSLSFLLSYRQKAETKRWRKQFSWSHWSCQEFHLSASIFQSGYFTWLCGEFQHGNDMTCRQESIFSLPLPLQRSSNFYFCTVCAYEVYQQHEAKHRESEVADWE